MMEKNISALSCFNRLEIKGNGGYAMPEKGQGKSFRQIRQAKKRNISQKSRQSALKSMENLGRDKNISVHKNSDGQKTHSAEPVKSAGRACKAKNMGVVQNPYSAIGPTAETASKLRLDPLSSLKKKGSLSGRDFWAAQQIRRAFHLITQGAEIRVSHFQDVIVQTSRNSPQAEGDYEVDLKNNYSRWVEAMDQEKMAIGPVFDVIIEEMSLNAVDRKWARRKGWAKTHLLASLTLYAALFYPGDRSI